MASLPPSTAFDVLLIADFTRAGDAGYRIAREIHDYAALGCRVGLLHVASDTSRSVASPDVEVCVRERRAEIVQEASGTVAKLAIVHGSSSMNNVARPLGGVRADKVVLVHDRKPDVTQIGNWMSFNIGEVQWAPTNRWVRSALVGLNMPVPILAEDWRPAGRSLPQRKEAARSSSDTVYGRISVAGAAQWPESAAEVKAIYPTGQGRTFMAMGAPPNSLLNALGNKTRLTLIHPSDMTVERLLEMPDVFIYFPGLKTPTLPEAAIATAMASGKIVVLPEHLAPHFGPGAIYSEPTAALETVDALLADKEALENQSREAKRHAAFQFPEAIQRERVQSLLGREKLGKPYRRRPRKKQALFIPSNGVGMGHVTRQLAIARRLDSELEPIFATLAKATSVIEAFGCHSEYIPSQGDTGAHKADWDAWFRFELETLLDRYDPDTVVFDGNTPTPGLIHAVLSGRRRSLVWVRRGMVGATRSPFMGNARFMDLVIEPGEIAAERDAGETALRRNEVLVVDPITLLDPEDLLPRASAAEALGIAPNKPAALLHLGAGANRDVVALTEEIIRQLRNIPDLQIIVAEWENSRHRMPRWEGVKLVKGFPLSRYFNAFDFSVGAAGYNSFHEAMAFGLPTVFVANRHPSMDDQGARAAFAQDNSAGFDLPEDQFFHLRSLGELLLKPETQEFVRAQCRQLYRGNGAGTAAAKIVELAGRR